MYSSTGIAERTDNAGVCCCFLPICKGIELNCMAPLAQLQSSNILERGGGEREREREREIYEHSIMRKRTRAIS